MQFQCQAGSHGHKSFNLLAHGILLLMLSKVLSHVIYKRQYKVVIEEFLTHMHVMIDESCRKTQVSDVHLSRSRLWALERLLITVPVVFDMCMQSDMQPLLRVRM